MMRTSTKDPINFRFTRSYRGFSFVLSIVIAMALRIMPLPLEWSVYNPDWVLLTLFYWWLLIPERVGVGSAWVIGLFCDVLTGRLLGQYALSYSIIAYVSVKLHRRLRQFFLLQQMVFIIFMLLLSQLLIYWTEDTRASIEMYRDYWLPSLTGAMVWPLLLIGLRKLSM